MFIVEETNGDGDGDGEDEDEGKDGDDTGAGISLSVALCSDFLRKLAALASTLVICRLCFVTLSLFYCCCFYFFGSIYLVVYVSNRII